MNSLKKGDVLKPGTLLVLKEDIEICDFKKRRQWVYEDPDANDLEEDGIIFKKKTHATYLGISLAWKKIPGAMILISGKTVIVRFKDLFERFKAFEKDDEKTSS